MKKIITLVLVVALVFSLATANFSVQGEMKNFFDMENITPVGIADAEVTRKTVDGETVYSATRINYRWCSLGFDILPAFKEALADDDFIEVAFTFEIKVDWTQAFAGHLTSAKPLLRAHGVSNVSDADAWNAAYEASLDGSEAVFNCSDGRNVIAGLPIPRVPLNEEEWITYTIFFYLERAQIQCDMTPQWIFCLDEMNGAHQPTGAESPKGKLIMFEEVLFRNIGVYYTDDYLAAIGTPNPTPISTPIATSTPKATSTPIATPISKATPTPKATPIPKATPTPALNTNATGGGGNATVATPVATPTAAPTATPGATAAPQGDKDVMANVSTPTPQPEKSDNKGLWIAIAVCGSVAILAVAASVTIVLVTKNKIKTSKKGSEE